MSDRCRGQHPRRAVHGPTPLSIPPETRGEVIVWRNVQVKERVIDGQTGGQVLACRGW